MFLRFVLMSLLLRHMCPGVYLSLNTLVNAPPTKSSCGARTCIITRTAAVAGLGDKNVACLDRDQRSRPSSSIAVVAASRNESVVAPVMNSVGYLMLA